MSLRLEMLQAATQARRVLGASADLVLGFVLRQQNADGGFKNRAGASDLYYTAFALDSVRALADDPAGSGGLAVAADESRRYMRRAMSFLGSFGSGQSLDFTHLCCLARAWAATSDRSDGFDWRPVPRQAILERIGGFRSRDGGFAAQAGAQHGTAYAAFLALGVYEDFDEPIPGPLGLVDSLRRLETPDGAFANERAMGGSPSGITRPGSTTATAAALAVLRHLAPASEPERGHSCPPGPLSRPGTWLLARAHPRGGFLALPNAPLPDLLSTATALHALANLGIPLAPQKDSCLDFIDSLWSNEGGFYGHWGDDHLDVEYVYYALLALGQFEANLDSGLVSAPKTSKLTPG